MISDAVRLSYYSWNLLQIVNRCYSLFYRRCYRLYCMADWLKITFLWLSNKISPFIVFVEETCEIIEFEFACLYQIHNAFNGLIFMYFSKHVNPWLLESEWTNQIKCVQEAWWLIKCTRRCLKFIADSHLEYQMMGKCWLRQLKFWFNDLKTFDSMTLDFFFLLMVVLVRVETVDPP